MPDKLQTIKGTYSAMIVLVLIVQLSLLVLVCDGGVGRVVRLDCDHHFALLVCLIQLCYNFQSCPSECISRYLELLHFRFVFSNHSIAVRALVCHILETVHGERNPEAAPEPNDTEDTSRDPGNRPSLR